MKLPFNTIYKQDESGKWQTLCRIRVNSVTIEKGSEYVPSPIKHFMGRDLEIEIDDDTMVVKGIY